MKNEIAESQTRRANLLLTVPRNAGISRESCPLRQFSCRMTTKWQRGFAPGAVPGQPSPVRGVGVKVWFSEQLSPNFKVGR